MAGQASFDLTGRRALITGGARGIGRAIADAMAAHGAEIVLLDIAGDGREAAAAIRATGAAAHFIQADIVGRDNVEAAIAQAWSLAGPIDILVNNAGVSARIPAEDYPDDALGQMIDLNIKSVFHCMQSCARRWLAEGRPGRIINLASFAGVVADPLSAPYAATKGAVVQLTRTCAVEWGQRGILVNAIGPGYVRTEMTAATLDSPAGQAIMAKTPLGRAADATEIAGAAVFLASPAASYVNGHILMVDGGWTAV
ncbi:glucose 1-dehydrogenase [Sphingomonas panacisoli]|uniref:Glucose 1-dehydrogenase n=1 Tax=Sphingomonas panacisoli TaxID=1813879 RepID=A0A5B8LKR9_9SPHN|nr:glucose 1-dehydrogenase [Sphingomonas panacisoli]QDZ08182.1 glucose 1-dehydrogenase [Sphingomonas panacisoli]